MSNHYDSVLYFQKNLNVHIISPERDFKLSIGSFNSKFPYTSEGLLNTLQLALCLRSQDFNMTTKVMKSAKQRVINQNWRKRQVKLNSNNSFKTSFWFGPRV